MHELKKTFLFAIIGLPFVALSSHIVSNPLPTISLDSEDSGSLVTIAAYAEQEDQTRFGY
tara:strand:+ start:109 stop:288 length:180 start_codon:yes stop_codon:yes gene_type:complete